MSEYLALNLHVALATYPKAQIEEYRKRIISYHTEFRDGTQKHFQNGNEHFKDNLELQGKWNNLYEPAVYHIFGNYDVAFISLTHSFKFSQRLFFPKYDVSNSEIESNSYQILTGLATDLKENQVIETFNEGKKRKFVCITNLKFSNGFLIGNGRKLIEATIKKLNEKLANKFNANANWLFFQSFSWFEISILFFTNNTDDFAEFLHIVRELSIIELDDCNGIITNSFYDDYKDKNTAVKVLQYYHVFSDTQSHIGVEFEHFKTGDLSDAKLKTQIEWITKPGQLQGLQKALQNSPELQGIFKNDIVSLTGKTDYWFEEVNSELLSNNQKLFQYVLNNDTTCKDTPHESIRTFFRNYRTRVLMTSPESLHSKPDTNSAHHESSPLKKLVISQKIVEEVYSQLRTLKVSRHIRQKINKIFFNYNIGINDPILYIYFLDLYNFVQHLRATIQAEYDCFQKGFVENKNDDIPKTVFQIELVLEKFIRVFSEANTIRGLNGYAFEEIYDFDLDVNSSCQQLLTTYNTIAIELGNELIDGGSHPQVVQLNLHNTESNDVSINYNVYHLINGPEFVLSAIIKEILNSRFKDTGEKNPTNELYKNLSSVFENSENPLIKDWFHKGYLLPDYYLSDAIRVMLVFNFETDLYAYWLRVFNFQNTTLYSTVGVMDERYFKQELFRLVFVTGIFDPDKIDSLNCPTPELASYWNRHFYDVKTAVKDILNNEKIDGINSRQFLINGLIEVLSKIYKASPYNPILDIIKGSKTIDYQTNFEKKLILSFNNKVTNSTLKMPIINRGVALQVFKDLLFKVNEFVEYDKEKHGSPTIFLYCMMYSYLKTLYEKNDGKVNMLRRNWKDGEPMQSFIEHSPTDALFSVDPHGGLFFADFDKKNEYYNIRNAMLQSLWHLSLVLKKDFIINSPKKTQNDTTTNQNPMAL